MRRRQRALERLDLDMRDHLEREIAANVERGLSAPEARRQALLAFGNVAMAMEDTRAVWVWRQMDELRHDVRLALRTLRRSPGFSLVAILTLAFGLGANTAVVSLANGLLFRDLAVPNLERLVVLSRAEHPASIGAFHLTRGAIDAIQAAQIPAIERLFTTDPLVGALSNATQAEVVSGELVSGGYFDGVGVHPLAGRVLTTEDDAPGAPGVVVISERLWRRWFNADPGAIGSMARMAGYPMAIVGVVPGAFRGTWVPTILSTDVWIPTVATDRVRTVQGTLQRTADRSHRTFARVSVGTSLPQLTAALSSLQLPPRSRETSGVAAYPGVRGINFDDFVRPGLAVGGAVVALSSLVFLIACANLTNLVLARAAGRAAEIGVRLAIGAGRARIFRLLLVEVGVLTACAGAVAVLIALLLTGLMAALPLPELQGMRVAFDPAPDWRVFSYAFVIAMAAALVIGLVPAWRASRVPPAQTIVAGGSATNTMRLQRLRSVLVGAQIAMSVVLLLLAGLYVRSSIAGATFDPGYDLSHTAMASVDLRLHNFDEARGRRAQRHMLEAARSLPNVERGALASAIPAIGAGGRGVPLEPSQDAVNAFRDPAGIAAVERKSGGVFARYAAVSPDFFATLGIPLRSGRDFTDGDGVAAPPVVIISQSVAQQFWPGDAIGRHLTMGDGRPRLEVVGVAATVATGSAGDSEDFFAYVPIEQDYSPSLSVLIRTATIPTAAIGPLREAIRAAAPEIAVFDGRTVADSVGLRLAPIRAAALVLGSLGALGLATALLGVYGVVAFFVSQRTREFGIRKALGATNARIYVLVLRSSLRMLLIGAIPGMVIAVLAAGFLRQLLYGVSPYDAPTFVGVPIGLVIAGIAAAAWAARRAAAVEPYVALRTL